MASKKYGFTWILPFLLLLWYLAARPCPFYQQGSCLFADACNFLHTVSAAVNPEALAPNQCLNHPEATTPLATSTNLPCVIVDSPSPVSSPRRSPRTTSLLLALRLIDPEDAENETNTPSQPDGTSIAVISDWSESLPTAVNEFPIVDGILQEEPYYSDDDMYDYSGSWTALSDYNDLSRSSSESIEPDLLQGFESLTSPVCDDPTEEDTVHIPVSSHPESDAQPSPIGVTQSRQVGPSPHVSVSLLSPMELSTLNLGPFFPDDNIVTENANSFDSGYAGFWKPPNPLLPSPPRSPSISSTFELLSSPVGTRSSRVLSPYVASLTVSPARTISPAMLDEVPYLDLNHASPQANTSPPSLDDVDNNSYILPLSSPNDQDLADISLPQVEEIQAGQSEDDQWPDHDSSGHSSIWDAEGRSTAVFVGPDENCVREQVTAAIRRQSRSSSLHFLSQDTDFVDNDALGHSSFPTHSNSSVDPSDVEDASASEPPPESTEEEFYDNQISPDHDTTAFLEYLGDPRSTENDTLASLYDIYSDIAPLKNVISDSIRNSGLSPPSSPAPTVSNNSTPASSLRERVFTPPPSGKKRSGTITSQSSPITSINPLSAGRSSPFSVPDDRRHPSRGAGSQSSRDELSKKVPFGFRKNFTMVSPVLEVTTD